MHTLFGKKVWAIPEGYIPGWSHGNSQDLQSHDAIIILNPSYKDAHIKITIFFENKDPVGPFEEIVAAQRTKHLRVNNFTAPQTIPKETPYSSIISSDVPVIVEYTRLDSRQAENAIFSTIAYPVGEEKII